MENLSKIINLNSDIKLNNNMLLVKDFDLYTHMKCNLKNTTNICEIHDSIFTTYCVTCRRSICEVCRDSYHTSHQCIEKNEVCIKNKDLTNKIFQEIDRILKDSEIFKQPQKILMETKNTITSEFDMIFNKLNDLKQRRLNEVDSMFKFNIQDTNKLNLFIAKSKQKVLEFLDSESKFFSLDENPDVDNMVFLTLFDILNECECISNDYQDIINNIKLQFSKYQNIINSKHCSKINIIIEDCIEEQKKLEVMCSNMMILERDSTGNEGDSDKKQHLTTNLMNPKDVNKMRSTKKLLSSGNLHAFNFSNDFKSILSQYYDKLNEDIYETVRSKIAQIKDHNDTFKNNIYDSFKKTGSLIEIDKMLKIYEDKTSKRIQYNSQINQVKISQSKGSGLTRSKQSLKIANNLSSSDSAKKKEEDLKAMTQKKVESIKEEDEEEKHKNEDSLSFNDKEDQIDVGINKNKKLFENKELLRLNNMFRPKQKSTSNLEKNIIKSLPQKKNDSKNPNDKDDKYKNKLIDILKENQKLSEYIKCKDDCNLKINTIRKFYSFSILEYVRKNFYKANKNQSSNNLFIQQSENSGYNNNCIKVFEGTSDIQIFDREKVKIIRKTIKIDKKIFGTTVFPNGCRTFFCLDKLYISGGKDYSGDRKSFWVYDIKEGKLEKLLDMNTARSFHSMIYHENLRAIMVFGGENNCSCEMYDFYLNLWNPLPSLNFPRANILIHLDRVGTFGYAICGFVGSITNPNYSDQIELLDLVDMNQGWAIVNYNNKSNVDLRIHENKVYPLTEDKLLIYGATESRTINKTYCIFDLRTFILQAVDEQELEEFKIQTILQPKFSEKNLNKNQI